MTLCGTATSLQSVLSSRGRTTLGAVNVPPVSSMTTPFRAGPKCQVAPVFSAQRRSTPPTASEVPETAVVAGAAVSYANVAPSAGAVMVLAANAGDATEREAAATSAASGMRGLIGATYLLSVHGGGAWRAVSESPHIWCIPPF